MTRNDVTIFAERMTVYRMEETISNRAPLRRNETDLRNSFSAFPPVSHWCCQIVCIKQAVTCKSEIIQSIIGYVQ